MEKMNPPSNDTSVPEEKWDYPCPQCDRPTNKARPEDEYEWFCDCGAIGYPDGVVSRAGST